MHILQTQTRRIDDGEEAVDLGQSPGDIVILTAADTEISGFAAAYRSLRQDFDSPAVIPDLIRDPIDASEPNSASSDHASRSHGSRIRSGTTYDDSAMPSLRIASLLALNHPYSVDLYADQTLARAKVIFVRLLGGQAYWPYGVERLQELANANGTRLILVSGDTNWDADLAALSTVEADTAQQLWAYTAEGGASNWQNALRLLGALVRDETIALDPPKPLPKAGLYWPGLSQPSLEDIEDRWEKDGLAAVVFYRSSVQAGATAPIDALIAALEAEGINVLSIYVSSLKDLESVAILDNLLERAGPGVVLNGTAFAVSKAGRAHEPTPLDRPSRAVLQFVMSGTSEVGWAESDRGLSMKDLTMHVVLPELDGRILTQVISFKEEGALDPLTECKPVQFVPKPDRIARLAAQAKRLASLPDTAIGNKRVAIILSNYPNKDGRIANGVGLDTPASAVGLMQAMAAQGYDLTGCPADTKALMDLLLAGPTNAFDEERLRQAPFSVPISDYESYFNNLPHELQTQVKDRWGAPSDDPYCLDNAFRLPFHRFGNVVLGIQPARGYQIDPKDTYHDPALVPPHNYLAAYFWLREVFETQAIVHLGKHGNLEWLPGKALALSETCWPDALMQGVPLIYPFIVNDPGEGAQAKRRTSAVIIDHLMPAMTRAESYGPLAEIETLIDEYFLALGVDPKRVKALENRIFEAIDRHNLAEDLGLKPDEDRQEALQKLDGYICELKELQIRDGLHALGQGPEGQQRIDTLVALSRVPSGETPSLIRALAADFGFDGFNPLDCDLGAAWTGARPQPLAGLVHPWRTQGDTVEALELYAAALVKGAPLPEGMAQAQAALSHLNEQIAPRLDGSGQREIAHTLDALRGAFVEPGPSGAPTRGRLDCLPTGRNFYSVDVRAVPTPTAWDLGRRAADLVAERYFQEEGEWPQSLAMTAWGTSNMRTGGDDIAQALALIGAKPKWEQMSGRVTGFEVIPLSELKRPRIDVTLRISGFFRDAFPHQIDLFDSAVRAIADLEEPADANPIAARVKAEAARLQSGGVDPQQARKRAAFRVFGAKPGAYGAGLQALIDEGIWDSRADLADSFINWGGYAYGSGVEGDRADTDFAQRLAATELVLHNQDNREHDILDSDDYYQFQGGMTAAVATQSGVEPKVYHGDHSRPEAPKIRSLDEEMARIVRGRAANPKWIAGMMRHGYKGAFEMAATLDYLFAYASTTRSVKDHHFEMLYDAYMADEDVSAFIQEHNPAAFDEMNARFNEAIERSLWQPRRNSILAALAAAQGG